MNMLDGIVRVARLAKPNLTWCPTGSIEPHLTFLETSGFPRPQPLIDLVEFLNFFLFLWKIATGK